MAAARRRLATPQPVFITDPFLPRDSEDKENRRDRQETRANRLKIQGRARTGGRPSSRKWRNNIRPSVVRAMICRNTEFRPLNREFPERNSIRPAI